MDEPKRYWMVLRLCSWRDFEARAMPFPIRVMGQGAGYVPVYESAEQAMEDFPGATLVMVELGKGDSAALEQAGLVHV